MRETPQLKEFLHVNTVTMSTKLFSLTCSALDEKKKDTEQNKTIMTTKEN